MRIASLSLLLLSLSILIGCKSGSNDPEFLAEFSGRYLYTENEIINVHSENNKLLIDWRGAKNIQPMKVDGNTFFVKDMNAKIQFLTNPNDGKKYLVFVPKGKNEELEFKHVKVADNYKTPSQHFADSNYEKALEGYLKIQEKDSLSAIIEERRINRVGYRYLRNDSLEKALELFKINIALYPNSANVYDSYAEALYRNGDTLNSIANYQKVLSMDSGNRHAKRQLERLQKKETKKND